MLKHTKIAAVVTLIDDLPYIGGSSKDKKLFVDLLSCDEADLSNCCACAEDAYTVRQASKLALVAAQIVAVTGGEASVLAFLVERGLALKTLSDDEEERRALARREEAEKKVANQQMDSVKVEAYVANDYGKGHEFDPREVDVTEDIVVSRASLQDIGKSEKP